MTKPAAIYLFLVLSFSIFSAFFNVKSFPTSCPSQEYCGDVEIKYPFWLMSETTSNQYCGYSNFNLSCSDHNETILDLPGDKYYVKGINYNDSTLTLVDIDITTNKTCPRARHNITLQTLPLSYNILDLNLSFYFNCSTVHEPTLVPPIPCLDSGVKRSYVFVVGREPPGFDHWSSVYCDEKVVVTVMDSEINRNSLIDQFGGAMNNGFVLNWGNAADCAACEASRGLCGYRHREFLCFCSDGTEVRDHCKGERINVRRKLIIGFGAAGFTLLVMGVIFLIYHRRNKKRYSTSSWVSRNISSYPSSATDLEKSGFYGVHIFSYKELEKATDNFDSKKELGDGGFGRVYQGKLRDGRVVAVKRLFEHNYKRVEQFMNEVAILTRLRHQNLVALYGCTSHHSRELLLVYEYIPNGTVADHLHGEGAKPGSLSWTTRMSIAIETASALTYLHASDVIHRDVKTNNILLDNFFCVKVADFGLSRLFPTNVTHVSTAPQGTPGYVDPEYHECYQLTVKSDVFSFGVVLIELISSLPAVDITRHRHEINLSNLAINKIQNHALHELVDPCLGFESDSKVRKMITDVAELAFQCLQTDRDARPSMEEVLEGLKGIQNDDCKMKNAEVVDIPDEDIVPSKSSDPPTLSPDSIMQKWDSRKTTPNASS